MYIINSGHLLFLDNGHGELQVLMQLHRKVILINGRPRPNNCHPHLIVCKHSSVRPLNRIYTDLLNWHSSSKIIAICIWVLIPLKIGCTLVALRHIYMPHVHVHVAYICMELGIRKVKCGCNNDFPIKDTTQIMNNRPGTKVLVIQRVHSIIPGFRRDWQLWWSQQGVGGRSWQIFYWLEKTLT